MTPSNGRVAALEQGYAPDPEIGWRIANPIMCALIGLIAGGWNGALVGLAAGIALIAAPFEAPPLFAFARTGVVWAAARVVAALRDLEQRAPAFRRLVRGRP
ncbi:MAG: hypothetical protein NW206_02695 [Hyphomonadaceae bacterium]|nr:hypothetical protein [Hyphomonadaceae bacterium]